MSRFYFLLLLLVICDCGANKVPAINELKAQLRLLNKDLIVLNQSLQFIAQKKETKVQKIGPDSYKIGSLIINLVAEDITAPGVDAIVNSANKKLPWPCSNICEQIYKAAGVTKLDTWVKKNIKSDSKGIRVKVGDAVYTPSFDLQNRAIKFIIHAVGPDCRIEKERKQMYKLADTYKKTVRLAEQHGATSVRIPPISAGKFNCDKKECAHYAVRGIMKIVPELKKLQRINLSIFNDEYKAHVRKELEKFQ